MSRHAIAALTVLSLLAACGSVGASRFNPANWFSGSEETLVPPGGFPEMTDRRPMVAEVTELAVERFPGGAIIRATGLPPTQGWWDAELVPENEGEAVNGTLSFRFVVAPPIARKPQGTPISREVTAAYYASDFRLDGVRSIIVTGQSGARSARR